MFALFFGMLTRLGSKMTLYLVIGCIAVAMILYTYHHWKTQIQLEARVQIQAAQLQQAMKENQDYQKKISDLQTWVDTLKQEVADEGQQISDQSTRIEQMIQGEQDRPSSQVLKDVIGSYRSKK